MAELTEVIITRAVETCPACPSQWDAWDADGSYWYLRYRHGHGTAERQPGPDTDTWTGKAPELDFDGEDSGMADGEISLEDFCRLSGLNLHPQADLS
jgi:hypothetical protein